MIDPDDRELIISCGAALYNLDVAARYFGYEVLIEIRPELERPDLLAIITLNPCGQPSDEDAALFRSIRHRHTNRLGFDARAVTEAVAHHMQASVDTEGAWLSIISPEARSEVAELVASADRHLYSDARYRAELAKWMRSNKPDVTDGIPGSAVGMGDLMAAGRPFMVRTFNMGPSMGEKNARKALDAPLLAILGTGGDTVEDWVIAGRALSRLLLTATQQGITAAFLNQPIEVPELTQRLSAVTSEPGYPQMMMYMGYHAPTPPAPRRGVEEVLRPGSET